MGRKEGGKEKERRQVSLFSTYADVRLEHWVGF